MISWVKLICLLSMLCLANADFDLVRLDQTPQWGYNATKISSCNNLSSCLQGAMKIWSTSPKTFLGFTTPINYTKLCTQVKGNHNLLYALGVYGLYYKSNSRQYYITIDPPPVACGNQTDCYNSICRDWSAPTIAIVGLSYFS